MSALNSRRRGIRQRASRIQREVRLIGCRRVPLRKKAGLVPAVGSPTEKASA